MKFGSLLVAFLFIWGSLVYGAHHESQGKIDDAIRDKIERVKKLGLHPLVVKAVREQNAKKMSLEKIKSIDNEWKSTKELTPFKKSLQESLVGRFLKNKVNSNKGIYNEAFLTDNQGANVTAYPATSDYWQGDETKWTASFNNSNGKIYIGPVEFDDSTGTNATQISVPVVDNGATIGVLVIGVKLSFIESRNMKK